MKSRSKANHTPGVEVGSGAAVASEGCGGTVTGLLAQAVMVTQKTKMAMQLSSPRMATPLVETSASNRTALEPEISQF
jgi:hypothetical protein